MPFLRVPAKAGTRVTHSTYACGGGWGSGSAARCFAISARTCPMSSSRTFFTTSSRTFWGRAPGCANSSTLSRKIIRVGMLRMLKADASSCSSSVLIFAKVASGLASATLSYAGAKARQGPHQGAHQSISTMPPFSTVSWKLSLVRVMTGIGNSLTTLDAGRRPQGSFLRGAAATGKVLTADFSRVHAARALGHGLQQLVVRRELALDEPEGVDAGDHERPQVRRGEPTLLQLLHRAGDGLVELEQLAGALLADRDRVPQRLVEVRVHLLQRRRVGAAGQTPLLLVRESERHQRRLLELQRELALLAGPVEPGEVAVHAHDLERLLAQVVRLLDVQREDLVRHLALGHHQRQDGLRAELLERGEPVAAVGRAEALRVAHRDDRVEVPPRLVHRAGELEHVRVGDVALEAGRLDLVHRQRGEQQRVPPQRLAVGGQHRTALRLHLPRELLQLLGHRFHSQLGRGELGGLQLHSLAGARLSRL